MSWYHRQAKEPLPPRVKEELEAGIRTSKEKAEDFMAGLAKSFQQMISERRVYCLTPDAESILMWSHYADNHRGICLEFGVFNDLFSKARQIAYRSEYPRWMPHEFEVQQERTIEIILTKAADWSYEREFRIVSLMPGSAPHWLRAQGDFFRLPAAALKSIIVGCESDCEAVSRVVKEHAPQLPLKRAVRSSRHYRLVIE
jgi:hypothetical protein